MTGYGLCRVKSEPQSEEEDSSQFTSCFDLQLPSFDLHAVKLEPQYSECSAEGNGSADILQHLQGSGLEELAPLAPAGPAATPVCDKQDPADTPALTLETLQSAPHTHGVSTLMDRHATMLTSSAMPDCTDFMPFLPVKDEPVSDGEHHPLSSDDASDSSSAHYEPQARGSPKSWTQQDMDCALEALRKRNMSLTKASARYGIPSTTLWQRAHRLGIDTPKRDGAARAWRPQDLRAALLALRAGALSANKASKAYGIPSSTLYKIARREGIRLAAPFNAAPTAWRRADLQLALASIRCGACSVQRAASQYGIPTGTLYGRCKREGIELSRSNPTPWSEDAMGEALAAVRVGHMSINQAAIHYNLPYSSLYGRFKRCKHQTPNMAQVPQQEIHNGSEMEFQNQEMPYYEPMCPSLQYPAEPAYEAGEAAGWPARPQLATS